MELMIDKIRMTFFIFGIVALFAWMFSEEFTARVRIRLTILFISLSLFSAVAAIALYKIWS